MALAELNDYEKKDITPAVAVAMADAVFGGRDQWIDWPPEMLREQTSGTSLWKLDSDLILALQSVLSSDQFASDPFVFEKIVHAFNHLPVKFEHWQGSHLAEIAWTLKALEPVKKVKNWGRDVVEYVRGCAVTDGMVVFPVMLKQFQPDTYGDWRDDLVKKVLARVVEGKMLSDTEVVKEDDPVQVQLAKLLDSETYTPES
jgi:hypothetical protein